MLKKVFVMSVTSFFITTAFAQSPDKNPYVEQMQQKFNQANEQATAAFMKQYPIPPIASSGNNNSTAATQQQTPPPPPPPPPPQPKVVTPLPQQSQSSAQIPPAPSIGVTDKSNTSSAGNIYAPGGNGQQSNGSNSYNPYR